MNQEEKNKRFAAAKEELSTHISHIQDYKHDLELKTQNLKKEYKDLQDGDKFVQGKLYLYNKKRIEELEKSVPSPYFMKCHLSRDKNFYLGKFSVPEERIYSWVTPIASLRFKKPGDVSYTGPEGEIMRGQLLQKDQFMITAGKILFFASESTEYERELIYQDYFSRQKKGFVLAEIVAQMEEAQDKVIRAHLKGSLLISGPAGSGKTTLALHRVAYLAQSPELSDYFKPHSIIVFVQDKGSKEYFSALLPDLGIHGVHIMTFFEWGCGILDLDQSYKEVYRFGDDEIEKDVYEYKKKQAFSFMHKVEFAKDIYGILEKVYSHMFSEKEHLVFQKQKKRKVLDRFDMVILLQLFKKKYGQITLMQDYYKMKKGNEAQKSVGRFPVSYSLMIFDEFQNYLPEEILLAKSTVDEQKQAIMYVGDIAQQTKLMSLQKWEDVHEHFAEDRQVVLQKVYRNTKHILEYIQGQGYDIEIGENLVLGKPVIERSFNSQKEEKEFIEIVLQEHTDKQIAVLARNKAYFDIFGSQSDNVHLLTLHEAQGLEFNVVIFAEFDKVGDIEKYKKSHPDLYEEKLKQEKDLKYVGLTRAIEQLIVLK
ncbi:AAA family ATPase [Patescibacteria group bacterium]|nr:AAA family ATPase [Patescibacteria group bacterium]MBU1721445.1 AAA family ATPase [Patescibacteria group bacterium]MBU1901303.1 AAA family ATPase [Patescibacteria group bacterium]